MSDETKKPKKSSKKKTTSSEVSLVESPKDRPSETTEPTETNQGISVTETKPQETNSEEKSAQFEAPKMETPEKAASDKLFNAKPAPKLKAPKSRSRFKLLPIIAIMISILALAAIAWASYNQYQMQQDWQLLQAAQIQKNNDQKRLSQDTSQTAQSSLQVANANQQIVNQQSLLIQQLRQALTATQQKVRALSGRQKQDWLLAEAEYLIKLAQLKISLEKDKLTAMALLKTADQRILETADNSLIELRQMIALDITDLQLVSTPDISGIAAQINAIIAQIPHLNLIALEFEPLNNAQGPTNVPAEEFSWSATYQNFLNDFVTIKDHSQPVKPLMTANQRGNLNSNIQLALQQAQIALVRGEQGLYEMSLNNAFKWIGEFFQHDQTSQAILETLTQVSSISINIQLPNELKAKQAIQAISQQRLYQWLENNPQQGAAQTSPVSESNVEPESDTNLVTKDNSGDQ
jgi:uroporphyrin-3 C-methyltransferase